MPKGAICSLLVYPDPTPGDFPISFPFGSYGDPKGSFLSILALRKQEKTPFEGPIASERERNLKILRGRIKI